MINNYTNILQRFADKGIFPYQMAFTLLIPLRNIFLSPRKLIKRLWLKEEHTVLEVGPGPGYFSIPVARYLRKGRLVLADIQPEMLAMARKRISKQGLTNVHYYLCDGQKLHFKNNYFDRIFLITVIGEIDNKAAYIKEFQRILKKDGVLSISELAGDPDKLTIPELKKLFQKTKFHVAKVFGNRHNYTINFRRV